MLLLQAFMDNLLFLLEGVWSEDPEKQLNSSIEISRIMRAGLSFQLIAVLLAKPKIHPNIILTGISLFNVCPYGVAVVDC